MRVMIRKLETKQKGWNFSLALLSTFSVIF